MATPLASELVPLPVGFERFHRKPFVDYQLNRAHSLGYARGDELAAAARRIRSRDDAVRVFDDLSTVAAREGRTANAAAYQRIAEFFSPRGSDEHVHRYRRYRELFDEAFGVARLDVPYVDASLPAYRLAATGRSHGTVLVHGGFDSLIEEFFAIWQRIAAAGFDVVAFDGPGQGGARILGGLTFDHDWERPVGAILDHLGIERATLVGISMGGYWAVRAAGREPRVDRVVSWPPVHDWLEQVPRIGRAPLRAMLRRRGFMRWSIGLRTRVSPTLRQVVEQAGYLVDSDDPLDAMDWFLGMNAEHLGSDRVTQDALVLVGEHDRFQPPKLARAQVDALTSARSVTVRTFTEREHADQHCQMGNLELACRELTDWLLRPT